MPSPRIIQTHLPFYLLHPDLLETSKVFYVTIYFFLYFGKRFIYSFVENMFPDYIRSTQSQRRHSLLLLSLQVVQSRSRLSGQLGTICRLLHG